MTVIAQVVLRDTTKQQYDELRAKAGWLDDPPVGGQAHLTWWEGGDCHNLDAWESEDALNAFAGTRLAEAMAAVGITAAPEIAVHAAHEVFIVNARTFTAS
jgi:hypothetical protein